MPGQTQERLGTLRSFTFIKYLEDSFMFIRAMGKQLIE